MPEPCTPEYCATVCANITYYAAAIIVDQAQLTSDQTSYYFYQGEKYRCGCSCGGSMMAPASGPISDESQDKLGELMERSRKLADDMREWLSMIKPKE